MNDLKEQAKKIIAKGKLLNDTELINMGLDMLDAISDSTAESSERTALVPVKPEVIYSSGIIPSGQYQLLFARAMPNFTDQFRVENKAPVDTKYGKKVALLASERVNKFLDDGLEAAELKGKTPPAKPKTKRKVNKVEMTCTVCGKQQKVLKDLLYTDAYRCDDCIMKGKTR